ncbi:hypothetical protein K3495_g5445 [Podosphaera aphanis]|nr:hypothetical protein K3495_g5445 [Podosphaera aphanis]
MSDPVGEDGWLSLVDEASRTAGDLEQRVEVVELYKRAIAAEPWSNKIWLAYCEWVWSLYKDCQNSDAGWPDEEQSLGQEIFTLEMALDVWVQGAQATQYRLNDSHELWNRWISIELELLSESPALQNIDHVRKLFQARLQTPHATWDDTSQMFSTFLTKFSEATWESEMVNVTKLSKLAKEQYNQREAHEFKLRKAMESGISEEIKSHMSNYINWERNQALSCALKRSKTGSQSNSVFLCVALFERALTSTPLGTDPVFWEDYMVFLLTIKPEVSEIALPSVLSVVQRATSYCPWSGKLWARYLLCAEAEGLPFSSMEHIKHIATNTRELDRDGMNEVVEFYIAWCGYLKRRTTVEDATDEDHDIADMGLPIALEDVQQWGKRLFDQDWKGDPFFRIEKILIQYLTQKKAFEEARGYWRKLVAAHANSYEFWQQYYIWEMSVRTSTDPPSYATAVLIQAINQKTLDWPEKIMEIYIKHCHECENVGVILQALDTVHRISKGVVKRRQREAAEYQKEKGALEKAAETVETESSLGTSKRKFQDDQETESVSKKAKLLADETSKEQFLKRDRENTTIIVANLPSEVTQTKVRQYFKDYAHINSLVLKKESDELSSTALIELRTREDVKSALLRNDKYFGENRISVVSGTGLTVYVTNFPPVADDKYFHELFKDCGECLSIRWPSIKYKTSRRFVYITFRTIGGAAAAIRLNGLSLDGGYKLTVAYSDPRNKKDREGATAEGREIHITSLDTSLTEEDLKEVFSKYGSIQKVNILKKLSGESKGAAFIAFEKKEEANAALELNKTKLKSSVLSVEISKEKNFKPIATTIGKVLPSQKLDNNQLKPNQSKSPSNFEITDRTIALLNIPDTVNDSRVRLLASPYGNIVKLVLRPDHRGAIIEYADSASAGKAALGLENYEILPGRKLRIGSLDDLAAEKGEIRTDKILIGQSKKAAAAYIQHSAPIRRPTAAKRGGLGQKKNIYPTKLSTITVGASTSDEAANQASHENKEDEKKQKSNADFRALFLRGDK